MPALASITRIQEAPDDGRVFVLQQNGTVRVIERNGTLVTQPYLQLAVSSINERGLLGIAFDPNYATNKYVYFYHTLTSTPTANRVTRFTENVRNVANVSSAFVVMTFDQISTYNHNGGMLGFSPKDGKLYVAIGEDLQSSYSQSLTTTLGKVLRMNSDGSIPTDNPFYNATAGNARSIFAMGLRNPYSFDFQPQTGAMFINDVGNVTWEEINVATSLAGGDNFGWPLSEGPNGCGNGTGFVCPVLAYSHSDTTVCAITDGVFYSQSSFPANYSGKYFYCDYCAGWIRVYDPAVPGVLIPPAQGVGFVSGITFPVSLVTSKFDGSLLYAGRGSVGKILWLVWSLDGEAKVDLKDLVALLNVWGPCSGCQADFDNNGVVDLQDLVALLDHWTQ